MAVGELGRWTACRRRGLAVKSLATEQPPQSSRPGRVCSGPLSLPHLGEDGGTPRRRRRTRLGRTRWEEVVGRLARDANIFKLALEIDGLRSSRNESA